MWPFVNSEAIENRLQERPGQSGQLVRLSRSVKHHACYIVNLQKRKVTTCGFDEMERARVSLDHHLARRAVFAVGAVGEPGAEGGEDIGPNASFTLLGGVDIVYLGAGTEGKESGIVWRAID